MIRKRARGVKHEKKQYSLPAYGAPVIRRADWVMCRKLSEQYRNICVSKHRSCNWEKGIIMRIESIIKADIIVAGGGLSGICAAIQAAKNGSTVALVQDRPVLGGNSSSEIRVAPLGAVGGGNRFAEEMGFIGSFKLESLYKNALGNPHHWDAILLDNVLSEPNILLFLNTSITSVTTDNGRIEFINGHQQGNEMQYRFEGDVFIDCTGDGTVGFLAGAEFMRGIEGKDQFNESFADDKPSKHSLGSTFCFESKDAGVPVTFIKPDFAYSWEDIEEYVTVGNKYFDEKTQGFDFWWIEYGGLIDAIKDNEEIRLELLKIVYGVWDYIKNSGRFKAGNLVLDWVQSVPGKRDSRRFVGDHVLTQSDLVDQTEFPDAICYGGWTIDRHPSDGFFTSEPSSSHIWIDPYNIPLRCLYSANVENLMFAGRNISATFVAFASARLMNTCALEGQAAGAAASVAVKKKSTPREVVKNHLHEIRQLYLKHDGYYMGAKNDDDHDIAKNALINSSGWRAFETECVDRFYSLTGDLMIIFPAVSAIDVLSLFIKSNKDTNLKIDVYLSSRPENYRPVNKHTELNIKTGKTSGEWIDLSLDLSNNENNIICILKENPDIDIASTSVPCTGTGAWYGVETNSPMDFYPCFKIKGNTEMLYHHSNITNGYNRVYGLPNLWVSKPVKNETQWVTLDFGREIEINEIVLFFNPDFNREFYNIVPDYHRRGIGGMPQELIKAYRIHSFNGTGGKVIHEEKQNWRRHVQLKFKPFMSSSLKIEVLDTWGNDHAEIFEVRVY